MTTPVHCPRCQQPMTEVGKFLVCPDHGPIAMPAVPSMAATATERPKVFISYGRRDASALADRLAVDLASNGFEVWQDTQQIVTGTSWQHEIVDGLRCAQVVVALMTPHSVRTTNSSETLDNVDSICLGEISYALFNRPPRPVVPVMAQTCEPPLAIFHLDYVDMRAWSDSYDQYEAGLQRLLAGIRAALRGEKRYRRWHHQLDPFDFASFLHTKRRDFTGRQWLFDRIDAWRTANQRERALLITGDPGTGKSAIVAELVHRNPSGQVLAYHCCQWDVADTLSPSRFVRSVAAMIAGKLEEYAALLDDPDVQEALSPGRCEADPASALEKGILTKLEQLPAPGNGPRYLLIDALDESLMTPSGGPTIVDLLASRLDRLPAWLRIVATSRKEPKVLERLAGLRAETLHAQSPENMRDVRAFLLARLASPSLAEPLARCGEATAQIAETLCDKSEGNFLYAQQALRGVESGVYELSQLSGLPPGLGGLYTLWFNRQFPDVAAFGRAKQVLDVVVAARAPLGEQELAAATELDADDELPFVLEQLAAYVPARWSLDGGPRYAIYHKSLGDWLTDRSRRGKLHSASLTRGHQRLAKMGWAELVRGSDTMSSYALRHLPEHLQAAERWDDLESLLTRLEYLESRVAAGQVFELSADFGAAAAALRTARPNHRIVRLLDDAFRRDIPFLARHASDYPHALFQCFWNRGWWHDAPAAADHYEASGAEFARGKNDLQGHVPELSRLLETWREQKDNSRATGAWLRALRPPPEQLETPFSGEWMGNDEAVLSLAASADGKWIVSGGRDRTVRLWNVTTGQPGWCICEHQGPVQSVVFSPDGRFIASGAADGKILLWNPDSGARIREMTGHDGGVTGLAISPDSRWIASASLDGAVRLWDAETGAELCSLRGHRGSVWCVAFHPDGRQLVSGGLDNTVRVWQVPQGTPVSCHQGHSAWVTSVVYSRDGERIFSGSWDKSIRVWHTSSDRELACWKGHSEAVMSLCLATKPRQLISASADKTVRVWDADAGKEIACLRGQEGRICAVVHPLHSDWIASGGTDRRVVIWNLDARESGRLRGHSDGILCLAFSPDGRILASGSYDQTIRLWDAQTGLETHCLRGHGGWVTCLAFSADGRYLASGSWDKTARVWDLAAGRECACLGGHDRGLRDLGFSSDGNELHTWSLSDAKRSWRLDLERPPSSQVACEVAPRELSDVAFVAQRNAHEVEVRSAPGDSQRAWFPAVAEFLVAHPDGRTWAAARNSSRHVYLFTWQVLGDA